jgi:hypothetical protein
MARGDIGEFDDGGVPVVVHRFDLLLGAAPAWLLPGECLKRLRTRNVQ